MFLSKRKKIIGLKVVLEILSSLNIVNKFKRTMGLCV